MPSDEGKYTLDRISSLLTEHSNSLSQNSGMETLYTYSGLLDQDVVYKHVAEIENLLLEKGVKKSPLKKCITILIEGLQNALVHGTSVGESKYLGLAISSSENSIDIKMIGVTDNKQFEKVSILTEALNEMSDQDIKKHYLTVMTNGEISEKGGAGLGLITMVMKSSVGLVLEPHKLNDSQTLIASNLSV